VSIYVLRAGVPWRLRDWQQAGVWRPLHHRLLDWSGLDSRGWLG
jgi:hypothetical protein